MSVTEQVFTMVPVVHIVSQLTSLLNQLLTLTSGSQCTNGAFQRGDLSLKTSIVFDQIEST